MLILLVHEMGHYLTGRRYHMDVTLPYFIPATPPVGTFGAFIKIRSAIADRRILMEIGAFGPLSGATVAIPLLMIGLLLSERQPLQSGLEGISLGSSIIMELMMLLRFGHFSHEATIVLHPTALAAWFGLFVTAMNLIPIGQLDGGHVVYALFGPKAARIVSLVSFCLLLVLGYFMWPGWLVFAVLVLILGLKHPSPYDPYTRLDGSGKLIGVLSIILFVVTFMPVPIDVME